LPAFVQLQQWPAVWPCRTRSPRYARARRGGQRQLLGDCHRRERQRNRHHCAQVGVQVLEESGFVYRGAWTTTTNYDLNDIVTKDGSSFIATAKSTASIRRRMSQERREVGLPCAERGNGRDRSDGSARYTGQPGATGAVGPAGPAVRKASPSDGTCRCNGRHWIPRTAGVTGTKG